MRINFFVKILTGVLGLLLLGCPNEEEPLPAYCLQAADLFPSCPNYDPCYRTTPIESAEWDMVDSNFTRVDSVIAFVIDTAPSNSGFGLFFRPHRIIEGAEYRWRFGSDPRTWEQRYFSRQGFFANHEGPLEVTLEVTRPDTNNCLTSEEAIKSMTKTVYFVDRPYDEYPMIGNYRGRLFDSSGSTIESETELSVAYLPERGRFYLRGITLPTEFECLEESGGISLSGSFYQRVSQIVADCWQIHDDLKPVILVELDRETARQLTVDIWYDDPDSGRRVYRRFVGERN